jgi:hypothetical protein
MSETPWLTITRGDAPLLVSIPHTGTDLVGLEPRLVAPWLARKDADWHIDQLYDFAHELGATVVRTSISRTIVDVNRDPSGASLYPGQATTELCPTTTFDGKRRTRRKSPRGGRAISIPTIPRFTTRLRACERSIASSRCMTATRSARSFRDCSRANCRCSIWEPTAASAPTRP